MEKEGHDGGGHHRVGEKDGGSHPRGLGIEVKGYIERHGRSDEEEPKDGESAELAAADAQCLTRNAATHSHDEGDNEPRQPKAVEKHRGGVHPLGVKIDGAEVVGAVAYSRPYGADDADDLFVHQSGWSPKKAFLVMVPSGRME